MKAWRIQQRNLRAEMMTPDQLQAQLREHGVERIDDVKRAYLESDGQLSVITRPQPA